MSFTKNLLLTGAGVTLLIAGAAAGTAIYSKAAESLTGTTPTIQPEFVHQRGFKSQPSQEQIDKLKAVEDAMDKGDYEAWKNAVKDTPKGTVLLEKITDQDKFNKFVEARKIMKEARQKADAIHKELGIEDLRTPGMGKNTKTINSTASSTSTGSQT